MKMGFFGCSFTEGGGLNSPVFNEYAIKNKLISKEYKENYKKTRNDFRYSTLVGKDLNCEVENFGKGRSSNEYIFNTEVKSFESLNKIKNSISNIDKDSKFILMDQSGLNNI